MVFIPGSLAIPVEGGMMAVTINQIAGAVERTDGCDHRTCETCKREYGFYCESHDETIRRLRRFFRKQGKRVTVKV